MSAILNKMILSQLFFLISVSGVYCVQNKSSQISKPHILLVVADDLGWNDVSWHNNDVLTPNLKELALGGVRLNRSYVLPICTPTRSALLTGRYPYTIGRQRSTIRPCEPVGLTLNATLLPQALKAAGYSTHAVGKWHLGYCSWSYTPTYRGFDTFYGYYNGAENYLTHMRGDLLDEHQYLGNSDEEYFSYLRNKNRPEKHGEYLDLRNNTVPDTNKDGIYSTHLFASYIENLLESRNPADPMFLYLPFQSVHAPLMVPVNYTKPYKHIHDQDRRIYLGMVTALDEAVGRIVSALKRTGHYENSVIVFTTDNGGTWLHGGNNWPLRGMKTSLWEGGTRGVAFVHSPLLTNPGTVSNKLIHATDWYPTLVGLGGGIAPSDIDGFDQWNAISSSERSPRIKMVYNIDNTDKIRASVRIGDYKLIVGYPGKDDWFPPPELKVHGRSKDLQHHKEHSAKFYGFVDRKKKYRMKPVKNQQRRNKSNSNYKGVSKKKWMNIADISLNKISPPLDSTYDNNNSLYIGEERTVVTWELLLNEYFRGSEWINKWTQTSDAFRNGTEIRLYNISDDPEERNDLAAKKIHKVKKMLEFLYEELSNRYVPADVKPFDPKGDPEKWNNVFSPGWCKTE